MGHALSTQRPRPTQAERRDAMRARLLEATLDLIAEQGWAQTSTQKICKRAGVSRGAQTHHFPTKDSLFIAAVTEIVSRYQDQMDAVLQDDDAQKPDLEGLFDFLWDACFEGNLLKCWMEVMTAARTDRALKLAVRTTDRRSIDAMRALGEACADAHPTRSADAADLVELTVYLLRGMVVQTGVHADPENRARLFALWKQMVLAT
ncbi:MAG: TetR/AcrR family transcriptional regulator [Henriciella sp.]|nr:TetR/AcrR family transcriptional regulator [Henriciella sp.]